MTEPLFEGFDVPITPPPIEKLSPDRRRTIKQRDKLAAGIHPATGLKLADNGETCGSCDHLLRFGWHTRSYLKCGLRNVTNGPGTDIRRWWPACLKWQPIKEED